MICYTRFCERQCRKDHFYVDKTFITLGSNTTLLVLNYMKMIIEVSVSLWVESMRNQANNGDGNDPI